MLIIKQTILKNGKKYPITLLVFADSPKNIIDEIIPETVYEIEANNQELTLILLLFSNSIPRTSQGLQRWFGDIAKTIVYAFKLNYELHPSSQKLNK